MKTNQDNQRESFILYKSFFEPIAKFTDEQLGRLFRAIFQWQIDGRSNPEPDIEVAFGFFVNQFRIDNSKYQERCEKNRENAQLRWQMRTDANGCERIPSVAKDADNDNENDKDNDNENGLLKQTDIKREKQADKKREKQREKQRESNEGDSSCDDDKRRNKRRKNGASEVEDDPLILPYNDPEFVDTWNKLRRQPNWRNKSKDQLEMALKQLSQFCNAEFAVYLMENAIAGNYQGVVFSDTPAKYSQWLMNYRQWKQARQQTTQADTPEKVITRIEDIYPV